MCAFLRLTSEPFSYFLIDLLLAIQRLVKLINCCRIEPRTQRLDPSWLEIKSVRYLQ